MPSALFAVRFFIYIHENNGTGRFPHAVSESICIPGHFVELNLMTLPTRAALFFACGRLHPNRTFRDRKG